MKTDQVFLLSASMGLGLLLVIVSVVLLAVLAKPGMRPIGKGTIVLRNLEEYLEPRHIPWVHWTALIGATLFAVPLAIAAVILVIDP